MSLAIFAVSVFIGALLQRVSGMGLGLVAAPILMLIFGPVEGILIVNVLATINAFASTLTVRSDIDWKHVSIIGPALLVGIVPGSLVVRELPSDPLLILVGLMLLVALSVVTVGKRYVPSVSGYLPAGIAGAVGGFMNTLAGVAGPAITVYAQAARWDQRMYAATLQPIFFISGLASFVAKIAMGAADFGTADPLVWPVGLAALAMGLFIGVKVAPRVSKSTGRAIALTLAILGGVVAVVRGVLGVTGG